LKIFVIGLGKTGTSSLSLALQQLGYQVIQNPASLQLIHWVDAATDDPIALNFEALDQLFPHSRFIYTCRDTESWLESWRARVQREDRSDLYPNLHPNLLSLRLQAFGQTEFCPKAWLAGYHRHWSRVEHYFSRRERDILYLRLGDGNEWRSLAGFLDKPIPDGPFPHVNQKGEFHG
jgi:hypothetical protein